jgi:tRNA (cytidine/uridine-2'-O-)-methyltransferase
VRLALYQPEIPQNVGTLLRTAACFDVAVDIIQPCGFPFSSRDLKRSAMDYVEGLEICFHDNFQCFLECYGGHRFVLLTTRASCFYSDFIFEERDIVILGRETSGVDLEVHQSVHASLKIPMAEGRRSLNVAMAGGIVLSEARRQRPLVSA